MARARKLSKLTTQGLAYGVGTWKVEPEGSTVSMAQRVVDVNAAPRRVLKGPRRDSEGL
jgi:hypothetical protein